MCIYMKKRNSVIVFRGGKEVLRSLKVFFPYRSAEEVVRSIKRVTERMKYSVRVTYPDFVNSLFFFLFLFLYIFLYIYVLLPRNEVKGKQELGKYLLFFFNDLYESSAPFFQPDVFFCIGA